MSATKVDTGCFDAALRLVDFALDGRINHTAQISLANDILCVSTGLRSAALIEQLYLKPNDIERIQSIFHHAARFNHLDLLSIGSDHIFIIHRQLLLQDIHEYLSESEQGLHHVFINVDYLLSQPKILPGRRYEPLDNYLKKYLLPDLEMRIRCWDQAELCFLPLPVPDRANDGDTAMTTATVDTTPATSELTPCTETIMTDDDTGLGLSMVTLSGWLLGYPVNYVLPTTASMKARKRAARALKLHERALLRQQGLAAKHLRHEQQQQYPHQQQKQSMGENLVLPTATVRHDSTNCGTCVDNGNMSDDEGGQREQSPIEEEYEDEEDEDEEDEDDEDEDEEDEDSSHNSLANRLLVLTEVNLTANEAIHGLNDCCLFSFSYPSVILDRRTLATEVPSPDGQLPTAPTSPLWFTGTNTNPPADQVMNPFEGSLLNSNSNTAQSSPTTIPGVHPPALAVVPSIVPTQKSVYPVPPSMNQHHTKSQHRRQSSSRQPFDTALDSGSNDDPSSSSSSPYNHHLQSNTAYARDRSRSRSRGRSRSRNQSRHQYSSLAPSSSDIDQHRFHRSEEPLYHHHQHHHRLFHHQHHREELSKKREGEENHKPLPLGHPEICAAGRSMLQVLHSRFLRQRVWKTWEVGQQTVTLPVVAL